MATFKQYLQNRWYRWMSFDKEVAYPYQFWYWENVNIRNEKWAVMLSSLVQDYLIYHEEQQEYVPMNWIIRTKPVWHWLHEDYILYPSWRHWDTHTDYKTAWFASVDLVHSRLTSSAVLLKNYDNTYRCPYWPFIENFRKWVFVCNTAGTTIYYINRTWHAAISDTWEIEWINILTILSNLWYIIEYAQSWWWPLPESVTSVYNYADTFFLIWFWNILLRYEPLTDTYTDTANWKVIRDFWYWWRITWLSQSWNYLKIYVTDWVITRCHYAQWTFDLEESWLVQTVTYEWYLVEDCLATDWVKDYWLFTTHSWLRLLEMDWYSNTLIRETKRVRWWWAIGWYYVPLFYSKYNACWDVPARVRYHAWIVYCSIPEEWVWTFSKESVWSHWYVWWWVIEWNQKYIGQLEISQKKLVMCVANATNWEDNLDFRVYETLKRADLDNHPEWFNKTWFIIWNIYTAWCSSLFKKNVNATIAYWQIDDDNYLEESHTNIKLFYRYDRIWLNWKQPNNWDYWWNLIKNITVNNVYDMAFTTTWSSFNVPRNTIQYGIVLSRDDSYDLRSPILYEHNLIYEDSMRKYR